MLRVNVRGRRVQRFTRQQFELGLNETKITPAAVFLRQPARADIAGTVDQELGVQFWNPDHVHFPVVKAASIQAISRGHVRSIAICDKDFTGCQLTQRLANLARSNQDDLRAKRSQPLPGTQ